MVLPLHIQICAGRYDSLSGPEEFLSQSNADVCPAIDGPLKSLSNGEDVGSLGTQSLVIENKRITLMNTQQPSLMTLHRLQNHYMKQFSGL